MKNEVIRPGTELSLPVPSGTKSGEPVKVGGFVGVAATDRGAGGNLSTHATVLLDGRVFEFDVDGAITSVGTPIYITAARGLQTSSTSADLFGHTVCAADGSFTTKATGVGRALVKPLTV